MLELDSVTRDSLGHDGGVAGATGAALLGASPTSILGELLRYTRILQGLLQQAHDGAPDSRTWGPPPGFEIGDGPGVEPEPNRHFALGETEPAADGPEPFGDRASGGSWVHTQEGNHEWPVANRGLVPTEFPPSDGLAGDPPAACQGSLR